MAQSLFREKGYAATSMRDLAETLGIEAASLYNHIASKEEILQQICFSMADAFFAAFEAANDPSLPARERLRNVTEAHLGVIAANNDASAVFLYEWRHMGEPFLSDFKLMRRRYEALFRSIIEQGIHAGEFRALEPGVATKTLLSATNWTYESYTSARSSSESIASEIARIILEGIIQ